MKSKNITFNKNKDITLKRGERNSAHDLIFYSFDTILKNKHLFDENLAQLVQKSQQHPARVNRAKTYITSYFNNVTKKSKIFKWVTPSGTVPGKFWNQSIKFLDFDRIAKKYSKVEDVVEDMFENSDVKIFCQCPDFLYKGFKYMAYNQGYGLKKEDRYPNIRNPNLRGAMCLETGTRVLMGNGKYKNIEDIEIGDKVFTHTGNVKKVKDKSSRVVNKLNYVKVRGINKKIGITDEHPFYVLRGYMYCQCGCGEKFGNYKHQTRYTLLNRIFKQGHYSKVSSKERNKIKKRSPYNKQWVDTKDLVHRDMLLMPKLNFYKYSNVSKDFVWFIGYYLADGHIKSREIKNNGRVDKFVYVYNNKVYAVDCVIFSMASYIDDQFKQLLKEKLERLNIFNYKFKEQSKNKGKDKWLDLFVSDKDFIGDLFNNGWFGSYKYNIDKYVNPIIFNYSKELKFEFLKGFFMGDGSIDERGYLYFLNKNKDIIDALTVIFQNLKIPFEVNYKDDQDRRVSHVKLNSQESREVKTRFKEEMNYKFSSSIWKSINRSTNNTYKNYMIRSFIDEQSIFEDYVNKYIEVMEELKAEKVLKAN